MTGPKKGIALFIARSKVLYILYSHVTTKWWFDRERKAMK